MAAFALDSGRSADLAFDPVRQTLISVQPGKLVRWPMNLATWSELACVRAQRDLSYSAWRTSFPGEKNYDSARICPDYHYRLDVAFANARLEEAKKAIDDCTSGQLTKGMGLLQEAARLGLDVDPPLKIDPLDTVLHVVSDRALDDLRQPSHAYDEHALACLQQAAELVKAERPALDPAQALEVGRRLVKAETLLADPQQAGTGPAAGDLEWLLEHSAQWPVALPSVHRMLSQAYFRFCQRGDAESCKHLEATAETMAYGQEVSGDLKSGQKDSWYFKGKQGDVVSIALDAERGAFDAYLELQGPDAVRRTDDDSGPNTNSLLEYLLPSDGFYLIVSSALDDGRGAYRLTLKGARPGKLDFGRPMTSTTQADPYWIFEGKPGQAISLTLETAADGFDPYLTLQQADGITLAKDDNGGGGRSARIAPFILPADGRYLVKTRRPGSTPAPRPTPSRWRP